MLKQAVGHSNSCALNGYNKTLQTKFKAYFSVPLISLSNRLIIFIILLDFIFVEILFKSGSTNMWPTAPLWSSSKVFTALGHSNSFNNAIQHTQYNWSTEQNTATLLAEKMFTNYTSSKNFMVKPCINNTEHFLLPTDAHNVKKRSVIKTF